MSALQQPGALAGDDVRRALPKTIQHAIYLTGILNERYLWVDSLCVIQDGDDIKDQLTRMTSIFAHANIVIVAADGTDAHYGLHGLKGCPDEEDRTVEQITIPFGNKTLLSQNLIQEEPTIIPGSRGTYFHRCWTFQEFLFARRKICFVNGSVWFQCCVASFAEHRRGIQQPDSTRDWIFEVGYPALDAYSSLICDFNKRQLSYPQDCLPAITGLLASYTKSFPGGFLCGLPEMFFNASLLWQPADNVVRRIPNQSQQSVVAPEPCLPSWSWVGWHGVIDFDDWTTGNDWVAACRGNVKFTRCQTYPVTQWYTGAEVDGTDKRRIEVEWLDWRDKYSNTSMEVPIDWTRRLLYEDEPLTNVRPPDGFGKYLYHHRSCEAGFWYPIPIFDPSSQSDLHPDTRYLFGSVETTILYRMGTMFIPLGDKETRSKKGPCISLGDFKGEWAGTLRVQNEADFAHDSSCIQSEEDALQMIAISRGFIDNDAPFDSLCVSEYDLEHRSKDKRIYEYYNVMWIIWEGGIAYRKGLGRVYKAMWRSLQPTVINVVLG